MKGMVTYRGPQDFDKIAKLRGTAGGMNIDDDGSLFVTKQTPPRFINIAEFLAWFMNKEQAKAVRVRRGDVLTIHKDGSATVTSRRK